MVVRRRPSSTRITGAWNVLPAKPKPTSPTLSMTGIVHHALSAATSPCALVLNVATSVSPRTFSSARAGPSCSTHHGARMPPTLILLVGMATILAGIVLLRLNAFLALIAAAIVVSLLAPGEPAVKIARVAEGFGHTAGTVGLVIARAAIAGQVVLGSGAADRIVRAFLALLGEKRGATALCATGYVLSIPVFFDTVFYLLVPLARSMHARTDRNYLKYLLAIAAGAGGTHPPVPPTPRPLAGAGPLGGDPRTPGLGGRRRGAPAA